MFQSLKQLLETKSNLSWVVRLGLSGLRTQLQEALQTAPSDPGREECQEILEELDALLEQKVISENTVNDPAWEDILEPIKTEVFDSQQPNLSTSAEVVFNLQLKPFAEALLSDREISHYIGEYQIYSRNDANLWNEILRLLLRVPENLANVWRSHALTTAAKLGAIEDQSSQILPFYRYEYLYPGLKGNITASGLCLSNTVGFDPRLNATRMGGELDILAGIVSTCLKFIDIDPCLHHALKSVDRFGVRSLNNQPEKSKYIATLIDRFHRVQVTFNTNQELALRARLDLDEAIHSLVYLPCGDRFSWWGKLQQVARHTLEPIVQRARQSGTNVQIRPLWGTYADIYNFSKDDLQLESGGVPGEVSACLRIYAKINDEVLPGRVLFRSS